MDRKPTRRRFIGISAAAAGLALLPFGGLARAEAHALVWRGRALGAPAELVVHHHDRAEGERLVRRAAAEIDRLERIFSLYMPASALSQLNRLGALAVPPPELVALMEKSRAAWALSEGAFDPTVQPLWQLYARHFSAPGADPAGPASREVESALALTGFERVAFDRSRIAFARPGMALTLNGVAQGFITDLIVDLLRAGGAARTLVDAGEIRALGPRPDGTPWRVAIAGGGPVLDIEDRAIATSSGNGFRFAGPDSPCHLIDPRSGASASRYDGVSVIAPDATTADALSTAFSFMDPERIGTLLAGLPGVEVHLLTRDGRRLHLG
jgi:thiamine biosynthesis lipoprotein